MMWALVLLIVGFILLWRGADFLVSGAVGLAERMGISQLVVGLTVVAMGTSAPEVAAAIAAVLSGKGDIAIGNVYGSNIANLALIGGIVALLRPLHVQASTLRREIPAMLGVALLLWPAMRNLAISRIDAVALLFVFGVMIVYTIRTARSGPVSESIQEAMATVDPPGTLSRDIGFVALGLVTLAIGARAAVTGAVSIGSRIGLSDAVIGSTIVAVGTSLPELITCVVAARKGHHDISVGNLVGSNVFNTLFVTGVAAMVHPFHVTARFARGWDYWIMLAVSLLFAGTAVLGGRVIQRRSGIILLATYIAYLFYLLQSAGSA